MGSPSFGPLEPFSALPTGGTPISLSGLQAPNLETLALLLDRIPGMVVMLDRAYRYVFANETALRWFGLTAEQFVGRHAQDILGPEVYKHYVDHVAPALAAGGALRWEGWRGAPHGGERRFFEQVFLPYAPGGEVTAFLVIGRDLTELRLSDERVAERDLALQRAEQIKAAVVDNALSAIITADAAGTIVDFNPAAQAMFGLSREQALGRTVGEVMVPQRHRDAHNAGMQRMGQGGTPRVMGQQLAMHATRADGTEFPIQMVLWKNEVAGVTYYTASIRDMSEQVRAAELIERQREALRQSEKLTAMGSLLAGVAHELNNPLAIVLGRAALLEEKAAGQAGLADDARRIREAAERCARIVRTFLNMARSKPGERVPVQLNDLAQAAVDILAYSLRSHGIAVDLALDAELPAVMADGDQIGQVVLNLLVNAQQALAQVPQPGRQITVSTGLEQRRDDAPNRATRVWLRVADNGPGVGEDLRGRLFEPYFTTKPEGSGTGLGLAVSRSIARDHGGDLVLERPPAGASFRLSLPQSGQAEAVLSEPVPLDEAPASAARVLVVDDEPEIADLLRELLEAGGYDVMTAESGAVALALLGEARFDAVVSDLHMPDVDGAALWREIKARQPALARRMLFVTGDTLSPSVQKFLNDARCDALSKPFTRATLQAKLGEMLART